MLKKKQINQHSLIYESLTHESADNNQAFSDEALNQLYDAIKRLSEVDRGIILLYLEENSYKEIAEITGTNPNNIGVRITRIKERLKKLLNG
jgi:RNA polymerase sigma-70 factor (ECF subfamily)